MDARAMESIIRFADRAHGEQKRKYTNERYIVHPVRVMQLCHEYSADPTILGAAILHDVIEDTPATAIEIDRFLRDFFSPEQVTRTLQLVIELTDVYTKENYPNINRKRRKQLEYQRLAKVSADAQTIKYADIMDNAVCISINDRDFGFKFLEEASALLEKIPDGNPQLYQRAKHTVNESFDRVKKVMS